MTDLAEAKPAVEPDRRRIGLVDLEEERLGALRMQFAQHRIHQLPAKALAAMRAGDGHGQDFALAGRKPRQHEADRGLGALAGLTRRIAEHRVLFEECRELAIGPGPDEILAMQHRNGGAVSDRQRLQRIIPAARLKERDAHQGSFSPGSCLGRMKPACGLASAPRR